VQTSSSAWRNVNPDYTIEKWHTFLVAYLLLILAATTNIWGRRALEKLSQIMIIFNIVSSVVIIMSFLPGTNKRTQLLSFSKISRILLASG
jgi:choline transport protein